MYGVRGDYLDKGQILTCDVVQQNRITLALEILTNEAAGDERDASCKTSCEICFSMERRIRCHSAPPVVFSQNYACQLLQRIQLCSVCLNISQQTHIRSATFRFDKDSMYNP